MTLEEAAKLKKGDEVIIIRLLEKDFGVPYNIGPGTPGVVVSVGMYVRVKIQGISGTWPLQPSEIALFRRKP
jgi:hypothetical protein